MPLIGRSALARRSSRLFSAIVLAAAASVGLTGVVAADSVSGVTGHYVPYDGVYTNGAICKYTPVGGGSYRIYRIVARPPSVWWPNRNSLSTTEHGRVGWRAIVQHKPAGTWVLYRKSAIQYATAYEDSVNPYGSSTKAPFTKIPVDISPGSMDTFRVVVKAWWYRTDGSILGWFKHTVKQYQIRFGTSIWGTVDEQCYTSAGIV
jgi:hypothetical protein